MGFTPYTTPTEGAKFISPLDLDFYAKGVQYKESIAEKNLQDISTSVNSLLSIPAYGIDKMELGKINQELRDRLSSLNLSNLSDIGTMSQIKSTINQFSNDPRVLAIAQRGSFYQNELEN